MHIQIWKRFCWNGSSSFPAYQCHPPLSAAYHCSLHLQLPWRCYSLPLTLEIFTLEMQQNALFLKNFLFVHLTSSYFCIFTYHWDSKTRDTIKTFFSRVKHFDRLHWCWILFFKVGLVDIKDIFKVGLVEPARRAIHWMPSMIVERQVTSSSIYSCDCFPLLTDSMNGQSIFSLGLSWKSRPSQRSRGNM